MAQRKPLNPNSTYGRKKLREQEQESYNQMSPDEKSKRDETVFIVLVIICILAFLILGPTGFLKWGTR